MLIQRQSRRTISTYFHRIRFFILYSGKDSKHRLLTLAAEFLPLLSQQVERVENYLRQDSMCEGWAGVWLPDALARKSSNMQCGPGWHDLFPDRLSINPAGKHPSIRADTIKLRLT